MANDILLRGKDRLLEISIKLDQSHLVYLQTDDSPLKLQKRHKLEGFIREFLCMVPNENKYVFHDTADILHRSAATVQSFSGYRAATAWSAISLYAANLLAQPWRKEYRTLRTYSGYYKHEVEANLIGAELMFEQMGYKHTGLGVLTLEGPIDPDKVSNVSRDAIVAFVECQILKQIWESVSQNFTVTWLEILEFRENHVGTPEQAIRALNYRFLEKSLHSSTKIDSIPREYRYPHSSSMEALSSMAYPMPYNNYMPMCQPDYRFMDDSNMMPTNYSYFHTIGHGMVNRCGGYDYVPPGVKQFTGCHPNPYCSVTPNYGTRVPTGKLIEYDVPATVSNYEKAHNRKTPHKILGPDEVDFYRKPPTDTDKLDYSKIEKKCAKSGPSNDKNKYESWDFVYRNLESLGYSKDLGDREDILLKKKLGARKQQPSDYDDKYDTRGVERRQITEFLDGGSSMTNGHNFRHDILPSKKKSSSFDMSDTKISLDNLEAQYNLQRYDKKLNSQTLPTQRKQANLESSVRPTESLKDVGPFHAKKSVMQEEKWNCETCTFLNERGREICEMCGKSRHKGNEVKPLASGGKECPYCTLVNEKNVSSCDACGKSLKDSPTYI